MFNLDQSVIGYFLTLIGGFVSDRTDSLAKIELFQKLKVIQNV